MISKRRFKLQLLNKETEVKKIPKRKNAEDRYKITDNWLGDRIGTDI